MNNNLIKKILIKENQYNILKQKWKTLNEEEKSVFIEYIKKYINQSVKRLFPERLKTFRCNHNKLLKILEN